MAELIFKKTNEGLSRGIWAGTAIGAMVGVVAFGRLSFPELLLIPLLALGGAVLLGGIGFLTVKSYESTCSDCGANLTKFSDNPSSNDLFYCPACGEKLRGGA